jgi:hypothetical protein
MRQLPEVAWSQCSSCEAAWLWSLVAGRRLVAERGRWSSGMRQLGRNSCWLKLRSRVGWLVAVWQLPGCSTAVTWSQCGDCLVAMRQLGSYLVAEPGCWKTPGCRARLLEWRHVAAAPVTQCVGYGRWRVEAASCPVRWA